MSAGGSSSSGSSKFSRMGTVDTSSWKQLIGDDTNQFNKSLESSQPGISNAAVDGTMAQHMQRSWGDVPYTDALCDIVSANMPGAKVAGEKSLTAQSNVNPYSSEYADNTYGRYEDEVKRVMNAARGGPNMTRGGTAAQGFAMSDAMNQSALNREDVLAKHRQSDASISQGASDTLSRERQMQQQLALQGVSTGWQGFYNLLDSQNKAAETSLGRNKLFNELLTNFSGMRSVTQGHEDNNLRGHGYQQSSGVSGSVNLCCFIFLESYNGELPLTVRMYRDMYAPEDSERRNGYIRMSKFLVPAMRVSKLVTKVVNFIMVKPLTCYANWFFGFNNYGWVFAPVKQIWFNIWKKLGGK